MMAKEDGVRANQTKLVSCRSGLIPLWPSNLSRSSPRTGLGPTSQLVQMMAKKDGLEAVLQELGQVWVHLFK